MTTPLTNNLRKFIHGLQRASERRSARMFTAEGSKCVLDTLDSFECRYLVARRGWIEAHAGRIASLPVYEATAADMERVSALKTAPEVLAVYAMPEQALFDVSSAVSAGQLVLALDCVQDPGNLGTIMRTADWMGITDILASADTVDVYSPKVVQSTMGAISRVKVHYCQLSQVLEGVAPVYGTFLDGEDIYRAALTPGGVVVMGNEGRGISPEVGSRVTRRLFIPPYGAPGRATIESLNVATATALTLAVFRHPLTLNPS